MKFKEFLQWSEEQSGTDKGLMGIPVPSSVKKPSDGQPFKQFLGPASGQTPRGGSGGSGGPAGMSGGGAQPMFMKKKMRKS
jgi:hypothetical protein